MSNTTETSPASKHDAPRMRFPLLAGSALAAIVGCLLFPLGGFMLFPVALDLWYQATENPTQPALEPVNANRVR